jgi:plastocyanin
MSARNPLRNLLNTRILDASKRVVEMLLPPRRNLWTLSLAALLALASTQAHCSNWVVQVGGGAGLVFNPQRLTIQAGDTVRFANLGGFHNVMANDGSFRCARGCDNDGNGGNGGATTQIWSATVAFPNAGTVGYFCEPHGSPGQGMFGTIIVQGPAPNLIPVGVGGWAFSIALVLLMLASSCIALRRR